MERMHKDVTTDALDQDNSVLVAAAREAAEEEQIIADMDDDFEDIVEERSYTKKEKEIAKMI